MIRQLLLNWNRFALLPIPSLQLSESNGESKAGRLLLASTAYGGGLSH